MAGFLNRFRGGNGSAIEADLRRITEADAIDVPKDALMNIVQASHSMDDRGEIMKHMRTCLAESCESRWRRVYGGLVLLEQLLQRGSRALMVEAAEGKHFDVVQRLTLLEHFSFKSDVRVQAMVRQKADVLRGEVINRLQDTDDVPPQSFSADDGFFFENSNGSKEDTKSHALTSASSSAPPPLVDSPKTPVIINGLVSVGHRDDTSSESGAEDNGRSKARVREELEGMCWNVPTTLTLETQPSANGKVQGSGSNENGDFRIHGSGNIGGTLSLTVTNVYGNFTLRMRWDSNLQEYVGETLNEGYEGQRCNFARKVTKQPEKQRGKSSGSLNDIVVQKRSILDDSTDSDSDSGARSRQQNSRRQEANTKPIDTAAKVSTATPVAQTVDLLGM